ncbi:hypothetical protein OEZ85_012146 [Tetradesmus obliquus]|uniref:Uncharacterized protein n=1 Tax=Tetradesmus obliquus TaxID=3088 RepID=A0ABY8TSH0_TETOB|nr:hypothetical protein OEZ85_012146 [Tetradesmus obliquus]
MLLLVCPPLAIVNAQSSQFAAPGAEISSGPPATDAGQQPSPGSPGSAADSSSSSTSSSDSSSSSPSSTDTCVSNPTSSSCTDYKYSEEQAMKDLEVICGSQPNLSACSLFKLCSTGVDPMSIGKTPRTCNDFHLLATACRHDSIGKNETGCANYRSLCMTDNTAVKQCKDFGGLRYLTPTAAARQLSRMLCEVDTGAAACTRCDWSAAAPQCDVLSVYGQLCTDSADHNECGPYHKMCKGDPLLFVCRSQLPGGRPSPLGSERSSSSGASAWADGAQQQQQQQWVSAAGSVRPRGVVAWLACAGAALLAVAAAGL